MRAQLEAHFNYEVANSYMNNCILDNLKNITYRTHCNARKNYSTIERMIGDLGDCECRD